MVGSRRRRPRRAWLCLAAPALACLFDPYDARNLPCEDDDDCGPKLECDRATFECDDPDDDDGDEVGGDDEGTCLPADSVCSTDSGSTPCCDSHCILHSYSRSVCTPECGSGLDCGTCCCGSTTDGLGVCAFPEEACDGSPDTCIPGQCNLSPSLCTASSDCCSGLCWANQADSMSCFTPCISATDCLSGCCSTAGTGTGGAVCQSADVCYYEGDALPRKPLDFTWAVDPTAAEQMAAVPVLESVTPTR